ncbi:NADH:ubiquinone reductase (Na(+)-transporting) subunit F [Desulfobulbus rhabdoformis]|uniref:NADH:ubiquinone reductase (Na(+)-transporting) subunit F n=1 Tax=Desulfobulbus rhabdoformis TaxID=34032 RepID=UPI001963567F|nr:NADH:ubiquinone reductase (Na(+)-transporting) subunit F [Desulfobulbus rhabdoformis]MBM9616247.1 NADH:ubiquinone reductase (Na(+)-transporting) subunit F [Desulfobulbus rhabdoformis]
MTEIIGAVLTFLAIQLVLVTLIVTAKRLLLPGGEVVITVNDDKELSVKPGGKLLTSLAQEGIFLSSACGGGGSCGQCRCLVEEGGGAILPTEQGKIKPVDARRGMRLSCQVPVKRDLKIQVPAEMLETRKWQCTVRSNRNVATFIKELVLDLPQGEEVNFKPGGYIQIEVPPHALEYKSFDIDEKFLGDWTKFKMFQYQSRVHQPVSRAYSMANYPGEKGIIKLNVRIASPPPRGPLGIPPGQASSYIFNLKEGDEVTIAGPFGEFFIEESDSEMIYIGGGAGMAPLRSHIFELFKARKTQRKVSFWYGGRSVQELFYMEEFEALAKEHDNFSLHVALSDPQPEDNWQGLTGFIHQVLFENYLKEHEAPEDINYYMCGPPVMTQAVLDMLDNLGVEPSNIHYDDFGG